MHMRASPCPRSPRSLQSSKLMPEDKPGLKQFLQEGTPCAPHTHITQMRVRVLAQMKLWCFRNVKLRVVLPSDGFLVSARTLVSASELSAVSDSAETLDPQPLSKNQKVSTVTVERTSETGCKGVTGKNQNLQHENMIPQRWNVNQEAWSLETVPNALRNFWPSAQLSQVTCRSRSNGPQQNEHGRVAPAVWLSGDSSHHRTGRDGDPQGSKEKSPLCQWEIQLNKASRRKADLQQMVTEMGVTITANETIQVLLMKGLHGAAQFLQVIPITIRDLGRTPTKRMEKWPSHSDRERDRLRGLNLSLPAAICSLAGESEEGCGHGPRSQRDVVQGDAAWRLQEQEQRCGNCLSNRQQQLRRHVQLRKPVLYEIACGPDSVLTEKVRAATGSQESAKRFSSWNGYDVSSTTGLRAIIASKEKEKPEHVWLSLECGPFRDAANKPETRKTS